MASIEKLRAQAQEHFQPGETALATVKGTYETKLAGFADSARTGIMIATDRRVVFYAKKLGGYDLESFPYEKISSVEVSKGWTGHVVKLCASNNISALKYINEGDPAKFAQEIQDRIGSAASPRESDILSQIRKLSELRDAGVLTESEFSQKKAELLARM